MIIIPIFRPMPEITFSKVSERDKELQEMRLQEVYSIIQQAPKIGTTAQVIKKKTGLDKRTIQARLVVLAKQGKISTKIYTAKNGKTFKLWSVNENEL